MKKIITGMFALSMMALTTSSWAAFITKSSVTVTAQITMGGTPGVSFQLFSYSNGATSPLQSLGWRANIDPAPQAANPWVLSTTTVQIVTNITDTAGGIQLVTDNKGPFANPKFMDPSPSISSNTDSSPAGLLLATAAFTSAAPLPLAWSIKSSTSASPVAADPNGSSNDRFQWLMVVDKQSPAIDWNGNGILGDTVGGIADTVAFSNGQTFSQIANANGIHFGQSPTEFGGNAGTMTSYLYFETNVAGALPQRTYQTTALVFEAFTE